MEGSGQERKGLDWFFIITVNGLAWKGMERIGKVFMFTLNGTDRKGSERKGMDWNGKEGKGEERNGMVFSCSNS